MAMQTLNLECRLLFHVAKMIQHLESGTAWEIAVMFIFVPAAGAALRAFTILCPLYFSYHQQLNHAYLMVFASENVFWILFEFEFLTSSHLKLDRYKIVTGGDIGLWGIYCTTFTISIICQYGWYRVIFRKW
jgi:hypothetical protein